MFSISRNTTVSFGIAVDDGYSTFSRWLPDENLFLSISLLLLYIRSKSWCLSMFSISRNTTVPFGIAVDDGYSTFSRWLPDENLFLSISLLLLYIRSKSLCLSICFRGQGNVQKSRRWWQAIWYFQDGRSGQQKNPTNSAVRIPCFIDLK